MIIMPFPSLSVIVPCYNEAQRVHHIENGLRDLQKQWQGALEILLVDDGSRDDTFEKLKNLTTSQLSTQLHQVKLFRTEQNQGKGAALQHGIKMAHHDFVLTMDADMATEPCTIVQWLEKRGGVYEKEIWIGSRELKQSQVSSHPFRRQIGQVFNAFLQQLTGLTVRDTQCGYKLYHRPIAQKIFDALETPGWSHDVEILLRANRLGYAIVEMPVIWHAVKGSKISIWKDSWIMFWEVIRIAKKKKNFPVH